MSDESLLEDDMEQALLQIEGLLVKARSLEDLLINSLKPKMKMAIEVGRLRGAAEEASRKAVAVSIDTFKTNGHASS